MFVTVQEWYQIRKLPCRPISLSLSAVTKLTRSHTTNSQVISCEKKLLGYL